MKTKEKEQELKFRSEGVSWLVRNASLQNPIVQTTLLKNIENSSIWIEYIELMIDEKKSKLMIYLKISKLGKLFTRKKSLGKKVVQVVQQGFPRLGVKIYFNENEWKETVKSYE
jgi:hypothetical protein